MTTFVVMSINITKEKNLGIQLFSALQIGDYHENNCEDNLYVGKFGKNKLVCAVMDGCTMAVDSYFASTLVGKIVKKISLEQGYREFVEENRNTVAIDAVLKSIVANILHELKVIKNILLLDTQELLTTLIIMIIDIPTEEGIILAIGDGFVSVNGKQTEFEQDNKPDYLGFHLNEDFETFYSTLNQKISFNKISDISISTDGIFTFEKIKQGKSEQGIDVIDFLTIDKTNSDKKEMLNLKLKALDTEFGLKPTDDFSMIRILKMRQNKNPVE
jgi:hypothetical protein